MSIRQTVCERRIYSDRPHTHEHDYYQILFPLKGTLNVETRQKDSQLDQRHLLILPPQCEHTYYANERNEFLVLDIPIGMFQTHDVKNERYLALNDKWKSIRFLLLNELEEADSATRIQDLIQYAARLVMPKPESPSIQYIQNHFNEAISLEKLAAMENYSPSYYIQWFHEKMGMTPVKYIQKLRVNHAKHLLLNTNYTIQQIAHLVGYEHQSSLTRLFQKFEGITPNRYKLDKNSQNFG